jgi:hypothetical protein
LIWSVLGTASGTEGSNSKIFAVAPPVPPALDEPLESFPSIRAAYPSRPRSSGKSETRTDRSSLAQCVPAYPSRTSASLAWRNFPDERSQIHSRAGPTSGPALRSERKARYLPSGDQLGAQLWPVPEVRLRRSPVSRSLSQISEAIPYHATPARSSFLLSTASRRRAWSVTT